MLISMSIWKMIKFKMRHPVHGYGYASIARAEGLSDTLTPVMERAYVHNKKPEAYLS